MLRTAERGKLRHLRAIRHFVVFPHRAQRPVKKSARQKHAPFASAVINAPRCAHLDRFHHTRNGEGRTRINDGVPVIG